MAVSIPPAFTLPIAAGDLINYNGQSKSVSSVAAGVDNGNGVVSYAVTLVGGTVITVTAENTILSAKLNNGTQYFAQTATI